MSLADLQQMGNQSGPYGGVATGHAPQQPNMGLVLLWGAAIGLPTAFVAGPLFARRAIRLVDVPVPAWTLEAAWT